MHIFILHAGMNFTLRHQEQYDRQYRCHVSYLNGVSVVHGIPFDPRVAGDKAGCTRRRDAEVEHGLTAEVLTQAAPEHLSTVAGTAERGSSRTFQLQLPPLSSRINHLSMEG